MTDRRARLGRRLSVGLMGFLGVWTAGVLGSPSVLAGNPVTGAVSTTDNTNVTQACLNGPTPATNCNIYGAKEDVWLSGLPVSAALGAGSYFLVVLDPGGQRDPNDGSAG